MKRLFVHSMCLSTSCSCMLFSKTHVLSAQDGSFYSRLPKIVTEKQFSLTLEAGTESNEDKTLFGNLSIPGLCGFLGPNLLN